jgi:hypothetical protein
MVVLDCLLDLHALSTRYGRQIWGDAEIVNDELNY